MSREVTFSSAREYGGLLLGAVGTLLTLAGGHACRPPTPCCELSRLTGPARPTPASASDRAKAVSGSAVLDSPRGDAIVIAFLCEDHSRVFCPPCPEGANCAACPPPGWLFCDAPGGSDSQKILWVDADPSLTLDVGRRYLLKGGMRSEREMELQSIRLAE